MSPRTNFGHDTHPSEDERQRRLETGHYVHRGDAFFARHGHFLQLPNRKAILSGIREKRFKLGRSGVSSRVVNHWEAENLIADPRGEGQGWRRYSLMDLVWLGAVLELRQFGLPIETLRDAHDGLKTLGWDPGEPETPHLFEFYVVEATQRVPVSLLVFTDGDVELATEHEYATSNLLSPLANHVRLSVNALVQKALPGLDLSPKHRPGVVLTDKETSVILALRNAESKSVTVRMKDGEPVMLETERDGKGKTVEELLRVSPHGELTVKQQDGKTVHLSQILKEKL